MPYKLIKHEGKLIYGKHLLLTANECSDTVLDINSIVSFVKNLIIKIKMKPFGEPIAHRIDTSTPFGGISVVQIIRTSTITIHTYDDAKDFYLDVFSCKDYDVEIVVNYVKSYYNPKNIDYQVIYRK